MIVLYISLAICVYLFVGAVVACTYTDAFDYFCNKFIFAVLWPIVLFIDVSMRFTDVPRKIANKIKEWFKK